MTDSTLCECKRSKGEKLYENYCDWVDHKSHDGGQLQKFYDLPDKIRHAWTMAALNKKKTDKVNEKDPHIGDHDFIGTEPHLPQLKVTRKAKGKK